MINKTNNMEIWGQVCKTPKEYTSEITGGRTKGLTSIKAQYTWQVLTQTFGPCGIGWGYEIVKEEYVEGHKDRYRETPENVIENTTIIHVIEINFWYMNGDQQSKMIPVKGQTTFVGLESKGWHTNEEAPKSSITDALTKAASLIGVSANVFMGEAGSGNTTSTTTTPKTNFPPCPNCGSDTIFEDKKKKGELYCWKAKGGCGERFDSLDALEDEANANKVIVVQSGSSQSATINDDIPIGDVPKDSNSKKVTDAQIRLLQARKSKIPWTDEQFHEFLDGNYGIKSVKDIEQDMVSDILKLMSND